MKKKEQKTEETALVLSEEERKSAVKEKKMTIYEYEDKYVRRENARGAKFFGRLAAAVVGVFLFTCLFLVTLRVVEIQLYVGIGVGVACLFAFIFAYLVPVIKIFKTEYFMVNVNSVTAREAQRHNRQLRRKIADHFIEINAKVDGAGWYDSAKVGELAVAVHQNDDERIREVLSSLFAKSVRRSANDIIRRASLKSGLYSAISQTSVIDSATIAVVNLQMIKDIVFLYGFRPSDAKLARIFGKVISNSLVAYGMGNIQIGNSVVRTMGDVVRGIPILGSVISTLVDSSVQGMTNAALTAVIGYQTVRYLNKEYRLQEVLDGIEIESAADLEETCTEVESELKKAGKKGGEKKRTPVTA